MNGYVTTSFTGAPAYGEFQDRELYAYQSLDQTWAVFRRDTGNWVARVTSREAAMAAMRLLQL